MQATGSKSNGSSSVIEDQFLQIFLENDGLYLCIFKSSDKQLLQAFRLKYEEDYTDSFETLFRGTPILMRFNEASVIVHTNDYSLLPAGMAHSEQTPEEGKVLFSYPLNESYKISFAMEENFYSLIKRFYPDSNFYPHIMGVLNHTSHYAKKRDRFFFAICDKNNVDVVAYANKNLVLSNSFSVKYPTDIFYYIASSWEELALPQDTLFFLCTTEGVEEQLTPYLSKCFSQIKFEVMEEEEAFGHSFPYDFQLSPHANH